MVTPNIYGNTSGENSSFIEKYANAPIVFCKNNIPAKIIIPRGSCALVFEYIFQKQTIKIPSMIILAIEKIDKIALVGSN
jgi:hypothetical protein